MPLFVLITGEVLIAVGFFIVPLVYRENSFTTAIVRIAPDQRFVTTGPYAVARHPQYAGALLYQLGTPFAFGSRCGGLVFAAMPPSLLWRLMDEEGVLTAGLPGYAEYCSRVGFRLIPGLY